MLLCLSKVDTYDPVPSPVTELNGDYDQRLPAIKALRPHRSVRHIAPLAAHRVEPYGDRLASLLIEAGVLQQDDIRIGIAHGRHSCSVSEEEKLSQGHLTIAPARRTVTRG